MIDDENLTMKYLSVEPLLTMKRIFLFCEAMLLRIPFWTEYLYVIVSMYFDKNGYAPVYHFVSHLCDYVMCHSGRTHGT